MLDFIELNCDDVLNRFRLRIKTNKERSIIFRKLKNDNICVYFNTLSKIYGMINNCYSICDRYMLDNYYFTDKFNFENENIDKAVKEYVDWFKPIGNELKSIIQEIDESTLDFELENECQSSLDAEFYLYKNNKKLQNLLKIIDNKPFIDYYKKYNNIEIPNCSIKFNDTSPYVEKEEQVPTSEGVSTEYKIDISSLAQDALANVFEQEVGRQPTYKEIKDIMERINKV